MRVLLIGGTRFLGVSLVFRLLAAGHEVTVLNRGTRPDPFGGRVRALVADRSTDELDAALAGRTFDAVVDFAGYDGADVARAVRVLAGRVGHYVFISSGQVYLVREGYRWPARESDYDGPLLPAPVKEPDLAEWRYGIGKREAEDVLAAAWAKDAFPATRLRIPMVQGARDNYRRLAAYLYRVLDGGPILLPEGSDAPARHVYGDAVVRTIAGLLGNEATHGEAYNLSQDDVVPVSTLVRTIVELAGGRNEIVPVSDEELAAHGLSRNQVSPFSNRWMSCLDPTRAKLELDFRHEPLADYLPRLVSAFFESTPLDAPEGYDRRTVERDVARRARGATLRGRA